MEQRLPTGTVFASAWQAFLSREESQQSSQVESYFQQEDNLNHLKSACLRFKQCKEDVGLLNEGLGTSVSTGEPLSSKVFAAPESCGRATGTLSMTFNLYTRWDQQQSSSECNGGESLRTIESTNIMRSFAKSVKAQAIQAIETTAGWSFRTKAPELTLQIEFVFSPMEIEDGVKASNGAFRISGRPGHGLRRKLDKERQKNAHFDPPWLIECRSEFVGKYDLSTYPFPELIAALFELAPTIRGGTECLSDMLANLHATPPSKPPLYFKLAAAYKIAGYTLPDSVRNFGSHTISRFEASNEWRDFLEVYRRFVREICAPLCKSSHVFAQCPPTLRVALPGAPATISMHCDANYRDHWRGEINFWLPVTPVAGANSLWLESAPERGDFRPVELQPGEFLRFNGYACREERRRRIWCRTRTLRSRCRT
eukprot:TRINITY_DN48263_c0_g1_i1.p1 TRINITY_DN48263_c0_g1~~TRINITY_DN48263_c0_g1_i1.p1  ORF type:complete len:439 (+),score=39.99 TRINITY_DN48263_c0_g1_i1:40-1317(+)